MMASQNLSLFRHSLELKCARKLIRAPEAREHSLRRLWAYKRNLSVAPVELQVKALMDPALDRLCERRRAEELRHDELFRTLLARSGEAVGAPEELTLTAQPLHRLLQFPVEDACDVMWTFLTLQVLFETFVVVLKGCAKAYAKVDPEAARALEEMAADDERYLAYATATAVRYEPSAAMRELVLERLRRSHARTCTRVRMAELREAARRVQGMDGVALHSLVKVVGLLPVARLEQVSHRDRENRPLRSAVGRA